MASHRAPRRHRARHLVGVDVVGGEVRGHVAVVEFVVTDEGLVLRVEAHVGHVATVPLVDAREQSLVEPRRERLVPLAFAAVGPGPPRQQIVVDGVVPAGRRGESVPFDCHVDLAHCLVARNWWRDGNKTTLGG